MNGVIIKNRYYTDDGMEYVFTRLAEELHALGATVGVKDMLSFNESTPCDFVVFWDKDNVFARRLEKKGIKVFNSSDAIRKCDDKYLTFTELEGIVDIPQTLLNPLMYTTCDESDREFLQKVRSLTFPLIAKACTGSQGKQVRLIKSEQELEDFFEKEKHGRYIYQKYVSVGERRDIRIYLVGGKKVACVSRTGVQCFKTNAACGGITKMHCPPQTFIDKAEQISRKLALDYCAVDFFYTETPLLTEVNSNAYFKDAEIVSGVNIAAAYAKHIAEAVSCGKK